MLFFEYEAIVLDPTTATKTMKKGKNMTSFGRLKSQHSFIQGIFYANHLGSTDRHVRKVSFHFRRQNKL